eukprot:742491-Prorocentrum_minimum.AAC.1
MWMGGALGGGDVHVNITPSDRRLDGTTPNEDNAAVFGSKIAEIHCAVFKRVKEKQRKYRKQNEKSSISSVRFYKWRGQVHGVMRLRYAPKSREADEDEEGAEAAGAPECGPHDSHRLHLRDVREERVQPAEVVLQPPPGKQSERQLSVTPEGVDDATTLLHPSGPGSVHYI